MRVSRHLDLQVGEKQRQPPRKRKNKGAGSTDQTPDLNIPLTGSTAIVPAGLVNSRVNQLDGTVDSGGESMIETLKKQRRGTNQNVRSRRLRAAIPAGSNENFKYELPGSGVIRGSSRNP